MACLAHVTVEASATSLDSVRLVGNEFHCTVTCATNLKTIVQASANLTNWISLRTNRGPFNFIDATVTNYSSRFYRAISEP